MGRIGEKSKDLKTRGLKKAETGEWPLYGRDYYYVRVNQGKTAHAGWIYRTRYKDGLASAPVASLLKLSTARQAAYACVYSGSWFIYPGSKPDHRWGPVCP